MTDLPPVSPNQSGARLSVDDLVGILTGLDPGDYRSRDLLPRANAWLASKDREPVSAKVLGYCLSKVMGFERRWVHGNIRAFHITPAAIEGRDWFVDTSAGTDPATKKEQP